MFKRDIINKYKIRFHEDFTFKEDLVFVCEYCSNIKNCKNTSKSNYQYRFTLPGKQFAKQDNIAVDIAIYETLKKMLNSEDSDKKLQLKELFIDNIITDLTIGFLQCSFQKQIFYINFFVSEFFDVIHLSKSKMKRIRIFKSLCISKNVYFIYYLLTVLNILVH